MTRLADITKLDRVGLPVWQAVRPASKALSVHQGKGATDSDARLGALLEAVESDCAERFDVEGPVAAWTEFSAKDRPGNLEDFAADDEVDPALDQPVRWAEATRVDGTSLFVPFDSVSLDFTIAKESVFERASAGLATGSTREDARRAALLELIERDAVSRFFASDYFDRLGVELDARTIDVAWVGTLFERLSQLGLNLRLFAPWSPVGLPVVIAGISDPAKTARPYAGTVGHAAHPVPELALFKAVAEALQSRLTFIAGAREDCWPEDYIEERRGIVAALAPPPVVGIDELPFRHLAEGPVTLDALIERTLAAGVGDLAFLSIAEPYGLFVERAFAPGLGSLAKRPRL